MVFSSLKLMILPFPSGLHRAQRDTLEALTIFRQTLGISATAWPFQLNPATLNFAFLDKVQATTTEHKNLFA